MKQLLALNNLLAKIKSDEKGVNYKVIAGAFREIQKVWGETNWRGIFISISLFVKQNVPKGGGARTVAPPPLYAYG